MGKSQREKGADAEREVAKILNDYGFMARRGQVFNGEPDIVAPQLPYHFEVKRQETLKITEWWKQSESASHGKIPTVVFRRNREQWKIMLSLTDFLEILKSKGEEI